MNKFKTKLLATAVFACAIVVSCGVPKVATLADKKTVPTSFATSTDTINTAKIKWKDFFKDQNLVNLIDVALTKNQELLITLQEIEIAKNDIRVRKGRLLPSILVGASAGVEKVGLFTSQGAGDASADIIEGQKVPENLQDYRFAAMVHWEVDVWKKLRNSKKAAISRYLATLEGKNFVITNLVAEVANSYYELVSLDNQLEVVRQNIALQKNALEIVKIQKEAAKATGLAVQKFTAEVLSSQSIEFEILQNINETENTINFLLGRFPQEIPRDQTTFLNLSPNQISGGIPSQMLSNRPDIKQAELQLATFKLDVKVARAEFYPSFDITAGLGLQASKTDYLTKLPESLLYSLAGDIVGPLINKNVIKAEYLSANSRQLQSLYNYDRTVLNAYLEISNQLSRIDNLKKSYDLKSKQVDALQRSIEVSNDLFTSARVDYFEVLMTQRDVLEAKLQLIESRQRQFNASIQVYKALGGGWR